MAGKIAKQSSNLASSAKAGAPTSKAAPKAKSKGAGKAKKTSGAGPVAAKGAGPVVATDVVTSQATTASKTIAPAPTKASSPDGVLLEGSFPLADLSGIKTLSPAGAVFRLDGGALDAMRMQVRRFVTAGGAKGFYIDFKMSGPHRDSLDARLDKADADAAEFELAAAEPHTKGGQVVLRETGETQAMSASNSSHAPAGAPSGTVITSRLEQGNASLDYVSGSGPLALRGRVRIRLEGTDAECTKDLGALVKKLGLGHLFAPPTANTLKRYKLMKALWRLDAGAAQELAGTEPKLSDLSARLAKLGMSKARQSKLRYAEVAPGHFTVLDDQLAKDCIKAGLRYAYSTVEKPEHVVSILQGGQKSTVTRWSEGAFIKGMSSASDISSGGAQGVFSRLVVAGAKSHDYWNGRAYRLVLKPEIMGRLDIWGHTSDMFGEAHGLTPKNFGVELIKGIKSLSDSEDNEIISPVGNGAEWIECVTCESEAQAAKLRTALEAAGWKPDKGTVQSFVRVESKPRLDLLSS